MMHWSAEYIGLPWLEKGDTREGVSCWGLACLVYRERQALDLPTYAERFVSSAEREQLAAIYDDATRARPWVPIARGAERPFDIVVFRIGGVDAHVGIITKPGEMLHISDGFDSRIERYGDGRWSPRLSGIYRHEALIAGECARQTDHAAAVRSGGARRDDDALRHVDRGVR